MKAKSPYQIPQGPTIEDCCRLWTTIKTEMITDCEISVILQLFPNPQLRPQVKVWSPGVNPETGMPGMHTWATRELPLGREAYSYAQLFDLLMHAYRTMEAHLGGQDAF